MRQIKREDLEAMAIGSAALGSGGGGNPAYDLLIAQHALEEHGPVNLITIDELNEEAIVVPLAYVGAPLIAFERLPSGDEFKFILEHLSKMNKEIVLMPAEIGGANGLAPYAIAAELKLPVLDADTLGRAFPEIQMSSCNLNGICAAPSYFADCLGNMSIVYANDPKSLERIGRHISISAGSSCGVAIYLMTGKEAKTAVIPGTVTESLGIGRAILDARENGKSPVDELVKETNGVCLGSGIITDIKQEVKKGFLQGSVKIIGESGEIELSYQNEYLFAREKGRVIATTPDILSIVERDSGTPITSDGLRYGLQVSLIAIRAPMIWQTEKGLETVGPRYFGYEIDYKPVENAVRAL